MLLAGDGNMDLSSALKNHLFGSMKLVLRELVISHALWEGESLGREALVSNGIANVYAEVYKYEITEEYAKRYSLSHKIIYLYLDVVSRRLLKISAQKPNIIHITDNTETDVERSIVPRSIKTYSLAQLQTKHKIGGKVPSIEELQERWGYFYDEETEVFYRNKTEYDIAKKHRKEVIKQQQPISSPDRTGANQVVEKLEESRIKEDQAVPDQIKPVSASETVLKAQKPDVPKIPITLNLTSHQKTELRKLHSIRFLIKKGINVTNDELELLANAALNDVDKNVIRANIRSVQKVEDKLLDRIIRDLNQFMLQIAMFKKSDSAATEDYKKAESLIREARTKGDNVNIVTVCYKNLHRSLAMEIALQDSVEREGIDKTVVSSGGLWWWDEGSWVISEIKSVIEQFATEISRTDSLPLFHKLIKAVIADDEKILKGEIAISQESLTDQDYKKFYTVFDYETWVDKIAKLGLSKEDEGSYIGLLKGLKPYIKSLEKNLRDKGRALDVGKNKNLEEAARAADIDESLLERMASLPLTRKQIQDATLIIVAADWIRDALEELFPAAKGKTVLFTKMAPGAFPDMPNEIPDPGLGQISEREMFDRINMEIKNTVMPLVRIPEPSFWPSKVELGTEEAMVIAEAVLRLAKHIHDNEFKSLLFSGRRAFLPHKLLEYAWSRMYPGEPMPKVYLFDSRENIIIYNKSGDIVSYLEKVEKLLIKKGLSSEKKEKICFVGDLSLSGSKYDSLEQSFKKIGFENMHFAYIVFDNLPFEENGREFPQNLFRGATAYNIIQAYSIFAFGASNRSLGVNEGIGEILSSIDKVFDDRNIKGALFNLEQVEARDSI